MLQSDTVAVATLYQQAISIFRMGVPCRLPLPAWQVRPSRQPRRWTTSYPTRLELRRWGTKIRAAPSASRWWRENIKTKKGTYCSFHTSFPGPLRGRNHSILYPCGQGWRFQWHSESRTLGRKHTNTHDLRGCWLLCVVVFISLITRFWIRLFIRLK